MMRETLQFPNAVVQVTTSGNVVYIRVSGVYDDDVALKMTQYLERLIEGSPDPLIRVWDASEIPAGAFRLTNQCIADLAEWAKRISAKKAGSMAYMVGPTAVSFGMARMYAIRAGLESRGVMVVRSVDELPSDVRQHVPA